MPIHLDDLLGTSTPQPSKTPSTTLDDVLDYVGAGVQAIGGLLPSFDSDPGGMQYTANVVRTAAGYMAKHPGTVGETQGIVSAVPFVGSPIAALAEPSIEYNEGTAPSHEANVGAVGGGLALATLLAAPKVMKKMGEVRGGEEIAPREPSGLTPDKDVEARSEPAAPSAEGVHLDDLLGDTSDELTDEEMAARLPGITARQHRYSPEAAIERENLPVEEFIKQRFPRATINNDAGPEWAAQVISRAPEGRPGLSIESSQGDLKKDGIDLQIVYRDPQGKPVAVANIVQGEGEAWVRDVATDKSQGLLGAKAASAVMQEIERMGIRDHVYEISPDAARAVQRVEARNARRTLGSVSENDPGNLPTVEPQSPSRTSGMDVHLDDLLGGDDDIVGEGPAPGKSFITPKYPWAQNFEVPASTERPATPPSEPVQPSAPNTDWLDDFPEAETDAPQQETPMPAELSDELPEELTSEPKPTSPEEVRNMIGADADAELANAKTTRKTFFEKGSAMLRKPSQIFNALVVPGDDVLLKSGPAGQEAVRTTRPIELVRAQAVGKADALYHDMTAGMTAAEKGGMGLLLDGQLDANSPNVTPRMRAAAVEARKFFDDYLARAQDAGTGVEAKQEFFPHFREAPIHDVEKPLPEFQKFGMESPSFHYHQVDDRAGYSLDLGYVMRRYAYNAESELQAIRAFGAADAETISNKISEWGDQIAAQGGDGVLAKKILLEKFNMESPELPAMRKGSRDIAATIGAMNTLTTPIRHIGKYVNSLSQIGFRGAGKGLAKIAEAIVSPEARQEIRASGVSLRNSMDLVIPNTKENAFYRITRALPWVKATKALDAGGRVMTYFGADPWIDETVRIARGDRTYLGSLTQGMKKRAVEDAFNRAHNIFGISEQSIESGELTPREREYARLAASDVTEFNPERGQLPYAATVGAAGRLFYNLRKFATSQANFMYNNVVKPASYGNIKPMARFLAGSAVAGAVAEPLLHLVNRQPDAVLNFFGVPLRPEGDQTWDDWRKSAMATGALHNLGLIYLMVEGRDVLQAVPMASAGLLGRGLHGAATDFVNAGRVSIGHPNEHDKVQEDLPQWWDEAQANLKDVDGKNVKDVARSTQMTWLLRKWYREARGLHDQ